MGLKSKDLLTLHALSVEEIIEILDTAKSFKEVGQRPIKKVPALRGKTVVNLFFEPSTRTRTSFELAAKRLSADVVNFTASASSLVKGECLLDTVSNIEAMNVHTIIMRHSCSGAVGLVAKNSKASVINAGDGTHAHPTQGLLDLYTIREYKKSFTDLIVTLVGDITHSRVARSNIRGLLKLGAKVRIVGPATLIPKSFAKLGVEVYYRLEEAIAGADVINILRIQLERQDGHCFPSAREYAHLYGVNARRLKLAKPDVLIMHPGPMNRGIEISPRVADGPNAVILDQVTNGVAVRMAVLYLLSGGESDENSD
ncbi:aspartate carbamoyltransferase catalytic subunit [bacterium]|nr:aspartate carbamoyltransferase catalytic subunit [bacterium]